jgi:hypothetical protein
MDGQQFKIPKKDVQSSYVGGISDDEKKLLPFTYAHGRSVDIRSNSRKIKLLPKTTKESGSVIVDLPKWADRVGDTVYIYGDDGNIYTRSLAGSHTQVRQVGNSHGNGLKFYGEDNFLYYTSDKLIGRYGPTNGTATFVDDFLGSEGGVPLNTHSIDLESGSSQYAARADTASLSITSDLAIEGYFKFESLPTVGNSMTLVSKWDESGVLRSYMFDVYAISGYFGDGSDGALTVSVNTTEAPIDSACTGTSGTTTLSATNASFATGQVILIHQTQAATGAGTYQRNKIAGYSAGTITLESALNATYTTGAQVRVLKQYTNVTINSGITYTVKAWNGTVGGILAFLASGTVTITGTISAAGATGATTAAGATASTSGGGYRGGFGFVRTSGPAGAESGEGTTGSGGVVVNGNGGASGYDGNNSNNASGGGGGHSIAGGSGQAGSPTASGGGTAGSADLTTMVFGGAGGGGRGGGPVGAGGSGGGIVFISAVAFTMSGSINVNGGAGGSANASGGGGAGGSVLIKAQTATLGSSLITATGGAGGAGGSTSGGAGGAGRIHLDYYTSYTGTTSPALDVAQDNTLVTTTSYQLRLSVSSDGTNPERLTKTLSGFTTGSWYHLAISWDASDAQAEFFWQGVSQGTSTGSVTAIHNNGSDFHVGAMENSGGSKANFMDGKVDEVRVWNTERTVAQIYSNKDTEIAVASAGLAAYYQFDNAVTDGTSNANDLTASGSPVFTTEVPFSAATTRVDLDQSLDTSGDTYTLATSIAETAAHRQTFVPAKDPQKSIQVLIAAKGTGNWTLTVHDSLNRTIASKTVANASLNTGDFEFTFDSVWRPIIGGSYHFHLTSTVADGTVTTTTNNDLETVDFHTYYQFLVEDTAFHPIETMINLLCFGNERYLATWNGGTYNPHRLTLPAGYKIRCLAKWRDFLAIGCTRGSNIYSYDQGVIFFWDGISTTYNDWIEVPEGAINAMLGSQGTLYIFAGYQGDLLAYTGGPKAFKKKRLPKITIDKYVEIMPGAMTMWQAMLRFGAGVTDSSTVDQGVFTFGQLFEGDPMSISYDYPISTGNRANSNIQIGMLFPVEKKLLVGWKDNTSYGCDVVDPAGSPFATGTIERAKMDYGAVYKEKAVMKLRADFEPLASGETIRLKYKLDDDSDWTLGDIESTVDATVAKLPIAKGRHREIQVAVDLGTSTTTSPELLELGFEEDFLPTEAVY